MECYICDGHRSLEDLVIVIIDGGPEYVCKECIAEGNGAKGE